MNKYKVFTAEIIRAKNPNLLAESFVDLLENYLSNNLKKEDHKPLGLATGRTMVPIYRSLVSRLLKWPSSDLDELRSTWLSFNLDEYIGLPRDDSRTFSSYMRTHLADPLGLDLKKIRIPDSESKDPKNESRLYAEELTNKGGIGLQVLGLGSNGHIGFNEPPCSLESTCRVEKLTLSTRNDNAFAFQDDLQMVPSKAITLGLKEILEAQEIHLIVTGTSKSKILNTIINSSVDRDLPASFLRLHPDVIIWADDQALIDNLNIY
tara:strand:+ start:535 stop:1326 length:792 start_codon:yes stop_codon:yes gene_type:complete